jgi:hypothetical protein
MSGSVVLLFWDDSPNAAARISHITLPPRYQVKMAMENCLTSGRTRIHPDIES